MKAKVPIFVPQGTQTRNTSAKVGFPRESCVLTSPSASRRFATIQGKDPDELPTIVTGSGILKTVFLLGLGGTTQIPRNDLVVWIGGFGV